MPIIAGPFFETAGEAGLVPRIVRLYCNDTLATVTTAGYLNNSAAAGNNYRPTDIFLISYGATPTQAWFVSSFSGNIITLSVWNGDAEGPTTPGNLAQFSNATGGISDSGIVASTVVLNTGTTTMASGSQIILAKTNGTEASNAVTASGNAGVITTSALTTAGGASYAITWTNTHITATSVILLTIMGGTNTTENVTLKGTSGSGTSTLTIYNNTAATALNGTILIGYQVC